MIKSNKLPQKKTQIINRYKTFNDQIKSLDTDTTTVTTTILTSTHIFNR